MADYSSCDPKEPFIGLNPAGGAPVLDYNVEQETCFESFHYTKVEIPDTYWKSNHKLAPATNFWNTVKNLGESTLRERLKVIC